MTEKRWLILILALFILLGLTYAVVTPVFEASDELWHYPMIRHLADGNPLPVQVFDPAQAGPWRQEASQPPLYYYLGAALTFWINTADMEQVRWLNPHVDSGVITADGNTNLVIHDPGAGQWQGTLLAIHIVRFFSVFLGVATVYLTFRIAKEAAPNRPEIALGAAAVNAFLPMFLFISGAVNNDNLAIPLASLALLVMIRAVNGNQYSVSGNRTGNGLRITDNGLPTTGYWVLLGVIIGLALLTKEGTLGLLPLALGTIFIARWQACHLDKLGAGSERSRRMARGRWQGAKSVWVLLAKVFVESLLHFAILLIPVLLIAGWWYYRNFQLYGDWLGWSAFIAVLGQRAHPASLAQLWGERWGFMLSYWGLFGGVNVPMWTWVYRVLNGVLIVSVVGFIVFGFKEIRNWRLEIKSGKYNLQSFDDAQDKSPILRLRSGQVSNLLSFVERRFALVICLLFATAVVYGLVQWATTTWSSQGRLVFTAISALNVLLVVGLAGWAPRRLAQWVVGGLATFMFIISAMAPWVWIQPAYDPDHYQVAGGRALTGTDVNFADKIRLVGMGYWQPTTSLQPGESIDLLLRWEILAPLERDWSMFVHLVDQELGVPIAQRDMYPRQGLRPTSLLAPGEQFTNRYHLTIPETAVAPTLLQFSAGWYDFYSGERLPLVTGADSAFLVTLPLLPTEGEYANPVSVNFENELLLIGYEIAPRRARPGDTIALTLYWQPQQALATNYTFFAQVVGEDTTRWASHDLSPPAATSTWAEGEVRAIKMSLTLREDTPADVYPIIVGLYTRTAGGDFDRLQILTEDGRLTGDFLVLTPLRID